MMQPNHWSDIQLYFLILNVICMSTYILESSSESLCEIQYKTANCTSRSLTSIPQNMPTNITSLLLSGNKMTYIKAYSFRKYPNLTYIDLSNSTVNRLDNYSFFDLNELKNLNLEDNSLNLTYAAYPVLCFAGLTALQKLYLGRNIPPKWLIVPQLTFIYPDESLHHLETLEELTIDGLPDTVFGPGLKSLTNLRKLHFEHCYLNYIQEDMFMNTPTLTHLSMYNCHIYDSHNNSFAALRYIEWLDISQNYDLQFKNATHIFFGLQNSPIRVLNISWIYPVFFPCVILPVGLFYHLYNTSLEQFICNHNQIILLEPGTLKYFPPNVTYVSLRYNLFTYGSYIFELNNVKGVKHADLSDINLGHYVVEPSGDDLPQPKWPILSLPPNLENITIGNVIIHAEIPHVKFMNNSVRSIDISHNGWSNWRGPVYGLDKLVKADLSMNYCLKVSNIFLNLFPSLNFLNVSNNYLGKANLSHEHFINLSKLEVLDMANNELKFLSRTLFQGTKMLKYLYINNNQLVQFDLDIQHLRLSLFSLQRNDLNTITQESRNELDLMYGRLRFEINLSRNPLLCTCDNLQFLIWMKHTKVEFLNNDSLVCEDGHSLNMSVILAKEDGCKSYAGLAFGVGCIVIFFLSLAIAGLIFRYRWKIKYLYYVTRDRYFYRNQVSEERDFTYDAFISFANEDLDFVDRLMTNLEGQGRRLCVHHRDFRLGEPIGSNIVKAVQNSKHTVIILSENFLASEWCRYEFEMARMESVYASRNVLLVVKIEDVRIADVPRELLYMMNTESYLEYPDNAEDQAIFWVNLHQALY